MSQSNLTPILIITPYFAPQSHAAMFRVHKLVKYLPNFGYKPIVLTTDINYLYNEDSDLLEELPDCVEIYRSRYIEPSLRGVRMALGGRNRSFISTKLIRRSTKNKTIKENKRLSFISKIYSGISRFLYNIPDAHWTWSFASRKISEQLIEKYNINILYTTANPYSHLMVAVRLKEKYDLKWLADFRDPCGYGKKHSPQSFFGLKIQSKILKKTMKEADIVTGLAETYGFIFSDYFDLPSTKYYFIPTGLDDNYLPRLENKISKFSNQVVFVGEVMNEQGKYIFELLNSLFKKNPNIELMIIGREEINKPIVEKLIASISNWELPVSFLDHMPQDKLYQILASSKATILAPGKSHYWWNNFAKLVDYIALGLPVIADVPTLSEARKELSRARLGFFLERKSLESDTMNLHTWLSSVKEESFDTSYRKHYLASHQTASFAKLFDQLNSEVNG